MLILVLPDGTTYAALNGCRIYSVNEGFDMEEHQLPQQSIALLTERGYEIIVISDLKRELVIGHNV